MECLSARSPGMLRNREPFIPPKYQLALTLTCNHSSSEASVVLVPTSTFGALLVFCANEETCRTVITVKTQQQTSAKKIKTQHKTTEKVVLDILI